MLHAGSLARRQLLAIDFHQQKMVVFSSLFHRDGWLDRPYSFRWGRTREISIGPVHHLRNVDNRQQRCRTQKHNQGQAEEVDMTHVKTAWIVCGAVMIAPTLTVAGDTPQAGVAHFVATPDAEAIVQVTGTGPTKADYVDPAHAPKKP